MKAQRRHAIAFILLLCFVVFAAFSFIYVDLHNHHECTGVDCEICFCINTFQNLLKSLVILLLFLLVLFFASIYKMLEKFLYFDKTTKTPVMLRVRSDQ